MRKIWMGLLILISIAGLCACSHFNKNTEEMPIDMEEEISKMEEYTVDESTPVSIATNVDENGELTDYVEVSVTDSYVETEKITKESNILEDLGADSLDIIEMLMTLEEEYGITIPDEKINQVKTVGGICDLIDECRK